MAAKPSRGSLSSLIAPKGAAITAQGTIAPEIETSTTSNAAPAVEARDLKTMMCRVNRAGWSEMSKLAIDRDMNLEDMLIEACNELLRQHDRPPVIEKRSPPARKLKS